MKPEKVLYLIVHNIRSAYNVGSILRTADGAGLKKVYLSGYTPWPYESRESPYKTRSQKMIEKTSLGAESFVKWEKVQSLPDLVDKLKRERFESNDLQTNRLDEVIKT